MALAGASGSGHSDAMVISTSHQPPPSPLLVRYLRQEVGLSQNALELGVKQAEQEQAPLAVVLWRFGLISLEQFDQVLAWQEQNL